MRDAFRAMPVKTGRKAVALTYASAIDDPERFRPSNTGGTHFGLTSRKYQSGETDVTGLNPRSETGGVRSALYEAVNVIF